MQGYVVLFQGILDIAVNLSPRDGCHPLQGDVKHAGTQSRAWHIDCLFL